LSKKKNCSEPYYFWIPFNQGADWEHPHGTNELIYNFSKYKNTQFFLLYACVKTDWNMPRDELAYAQQENLRGRKKFVWIGIPNSYFC
jgi:hypothetical protein